MFTQRAQDAHVKKTTNSKYIWDLVHLGKPAAKNTANVEKNLIWATKRFVAAVLLADFGDVESLFIIFNNN